MPQQRLSWTARRAVRRSQETLPSGPLDRVRYLRRPFRFASSCPSSGGIWCYESVQASAPTCAPQSAGKPCSTLRRAIEYGGVLIKLGQFLSIRVDILPGVTRNCGLQEVPAETLADVRAIAGFKRRSGGLCWFKRSRRPLRRWRRCIKAQL